ncbi:MAG TPA: hypothetical protein VNO14_15320 [Blastocatellia bacterium]|nr:hypothetical protein [Blastocatellia bacterium]
MISIKKRVAVALILTLVLATVTFGQQQTTQQQGQPSQTRAVYSAFKGKIFEVRHRDPAAIVRAVINLGSGAAGTAINYNEDFRTITVRDFPENIAAIEEAIKRLDTPQPPPPDIEFRMHLLIASNVEGAPSQFPSDLGDVIKQLQSTLNYKSYHLLTSIVQRAKDGSSAKGSGVAQVKPPLTNQTADVAYNYNLNPISIVPSSSGPGTVQIRRFQFNVHSPQGLGGAALDSELGLREGEKVVVGTASLRDKAMVLVLTARVIK